MIPEDLAVKLNELLGWPGVTEKEKAVLKRRQEQELQSQQQYRQSQTKGSVLGKTE